MNKNATSELICFVRFPLAIGVVMGHCFFRIKGWQYDKLSEQGLGSNVAMEFLLSTRILLLSVVALFFLLSGYLFFKHLEQWDSNAIVTIILFVAMLCKGYLFSRAGKIIAPFFTVSVVMAMINLATWVVKRSCSDSMSSKLKDEAIRWQDATFLIFAFHFFILHDIFKLLNKIGGALTGYYDVRMMEMANRFPYVVIMNYLLRIVIIVAICMFVYVILRKFFPRVCSILCGR